MNLYRKLDELQDDYVIACYEIQSKTTIKEAAYAIAIGQSIGNPDIRNDWETTEMIEKYCCKIVDWDRDDIVGIAYPVINTDWQNDGISHLLCQLMGGHTDIEIIERCRLIDIAFPKKVLDLFYKPKIGMSGLRELTGNYDKPLFGSIIKPKTGITTKTLIDMVSQLIDGGVDFIKEDEIMSNPMCAPLFERVDAIANYLEKQNSKAMFCHTINGDPHVITNRAMMVHELGGRGVHVNVFSGLGAYHSIRKMDIPLFMHYQSSGSKVFCDPSHRYSISWSVMCHLATLCGIDSIQVGMIGGYSNHDERETLRCVQMLQSCDTIPILSCGMHAGLIDSITEKVGVDYLANAGGAVHGHPNGTRDGALAIRQAIDKNYGQAYRVAINKWGLS